VITIPVVRDRKRLYTARKFHFGFRRARLARIRPANPSGRDFVRRTPRDGAVEYDWLCP
jgi:hypothetical protein